MSESDFQSDSRESSTVSNETVELDLIRVGTSKNPINIVTIYSYFLRLKIYRRTWVRSAQFFIFLRSQPHWSSFEVCHQQKPGFKRWSSSRVISFTARSSF